MAHLLQDGGEEHGKGGVGDIGQEEDCCRCPRNGIAEHCAGALAGLHEEAGEGPCPLGMSWLICFRTLTFVFSLFFIIRGKQTIFCNLLLPSCQIGSAVW